MLLFNLNYEAKKCLLHQGRFTLQLQITTAFAMQYSGTNQFYEKCEELGLNQDILHRWMKLNGFVDDVAARDFTRTLIRSTKDIKQEGEK